MRQSYKEKQLLLEQSTQTAELEERNEQLKAEKERLLYDNALQRCGRPIEDDDNRSTICRGLQAVPPSLPPGPPSSRCSSVDPEQFAAEALANMAQDTSGSSAAAEAAQSADSFTVEVVEPEEACSMQAQAADFPEAQQQGARPSTTGPAGGDATPVTGGKKRAADDTVRQTPSLPPLILGANVSLPAGLGLVPAEAQRFRNWMDPSNGGSAVGVAGCSSSSSAERMGAALSGSSSSSGAQQMAQSFTYAPWPVRRLLGQQQSFGHVPVQHQQLTIPGLGLLQQQQQPAAAPWLSQPQLQLPTAVLTNRSPEQDALERLLRAHTAAQQLRQPPAAAAAAVTAATETTAAAAAAATAATFRTSHAVGPSLTAGSTLVHNETNLARPVPPPRAVAATLEEKFMKYVMCDYTPRCGLASPSPNPNPLHAC